MKLITRCSGIFKHLIALVAGLLGFSILCGLYKTFTLLESSNKIIPSLAIIGSIKASAITFLTGLFVIGLAIFIVIKLSNKKRVSVLR